MNLNNNIETKNTSPSNETKEIVTNKAAKQSRPVSVSDATTVNADAPIVIAVDHGYEISRRRPSSSPPAPRYATKSRSLARRSC